MDDLFSRPPYGLPQAEKDALLARGLSDLTRMHRERCPAYSRILQVLHPGWSHAARPAEVPWLPVGLFKSHHLSSVPPEQEFKVLLSSGTTGLPSRVVLDRETAALQTRALANVMTSLLGPRRLPMLVIDTEGLFADPRTHTARGAGVLGMMSFGRDHLFALDAAYGLRVEALRAWLEPRRGAPFLVFGFTWLVWTYLVERAEAHGLDLAGGILVHSGGWKKLAERAVSRERFRERVRAATGIARVRDFYGMVEQVGGVFLEGEDGFLYPPAFADVIVRDPVTWEEAPVGRPGVVQVLSLLPRSYPGHSLLTEDLGVVHGVDDGGCGRLGKYFSILGRVPRAEPRGCGDTHAPEAA